jgi:hypothetical protein
VGTLLVVINQGDALARGSIDGALALRIGLTFLVPFLVSTSSSIAAIDGQRRQMSGQPCSPVSTNRVRRADD